MMGSSACGLLLVLALMAPMGLAIKCYECNKIPGDFNKPCPGGGLIDFGSNHDTCVIYRLSNDEIVFQGSVDSSREGNICQKSSHYLKEIIRKNFRTEGTPMCCRSDGCNKDIPDRFVDDGGGGLFLEAYRPGGVHRGGGGGDGDGSKQPSSLERESETNGATNWGRFSLALSLLHLPVLLSIFNVIVW